MTSVSDTDARLACVVHEHATAAAAAPSEQLAQHAADINMVPQHPFARPSDSIPRACSSASLNDSSSSSNFEERCRAAHAEGLGPRDELTHFIVDGSFDHELYNFLFVACLDQGLADQGLQHRTSCQAAAARLNPPPMQALGKC